jgi:hypothetical protein
VPILVAVVVTGIVMVLFYVRVWSVPPVASGALAQLQVFPVTTISGPASEGPGVIGTPEEQYQLVVLAQVRIQNLSKAPLTVFDITSSLMQGKVEQQTPGASVDDIQKFFQVYPQLVTPGVAPLARRTVVPPGASASGLAVFSYPITQEQWKARRDFQITISFDNGTPVVLHAR